MFHLAAQPLVRRSYAEPIETFATNVMGTVHVLDALRAGAPSLRSAVVITTDKVYENVEQVAGYVEDDALGGHDPYSASKASAEVATAAYRSSFFDGRRIATARAGNVIGGGDRAEDRIVPDFIRAFEAGETLEVRNPSAVRPWQHVLEPLSGYLMLAARLASEPERLARAFNFAPDDDAQVPVSRLADMLADSMGGSWHHTAQKDAPHEATLLALDASLAKRDIGWFPVLDVAEAIDLTGSWYSRVSAEDAWDITLDQSERFLSGSRTRPGGVDEWCWTGRALDGRRILLTGVTGFVGSSLARRLLDDHGCQLIAIERPGGGDRWRVHDIEDE